VSAADRRRDSVALALFAMGAFLGLVSFRGFRRMAQMPIVPLAGSTAVGHADHLWRLALAGLALFAAGGAALTWSYWRYRARQTAP
jgi:hypothetical protein